MSISDPAASPPCDQRSNGLERPRHRLWLRGLLWVVWLLQVSSLPAQALDAEKLREQLRPLMQKGVLVVERDQEVVFEAQFGSPQESWVPASTLKIATALYALEHWGPAHRFVTEVYLREGQDLILRGSGDPFLVSEEIRRLGRALGQLGQGAYRRLWFDVSAFEFPLRADGVEPSRNPYDALNGALIVNFNTVHLQKLADGSVRSAEPQTPLTPMALQLGAQIAAGTERLNLSADPQASLRYAAELIQTIWQEDGLRFTEPAQTVLLTAVRPEDQLLFRFQNSRSLREVVEGMLRYSNNFIANQLLLAVAAERSPLRPVTFPSAVEQWQKWWRARLQLGADDLRVVEASGISRRNRITPAAMLITLRNFQEWAELLPLRHNSRVKTGTLRGIYTLSGFMNSDREYAFVLFLAQPTNTRDQVLQHLQQAFP